MAFWHPSSEVEAGQPRDRTEHPEDEDAVALAGRVDIEARVRMEDVGYHQADYVAS